MNTMERQSIKEWAKEERPREKLLRKGEHELDTTELIAILLRTGVKGQSAVDVARVVMKKFGTLRNMSHSDMRQWEDIKGLGPAKIAQLKAAIEISRRMFQEMLNEKPKVNSPKEVAEMLMGRFRDLKTELFWVLHLDSRNRVIHTDEIDDGTVNQAHPVIRTIFQKALERHAVSLICVHNHPSGDPSPSREDREFTRVLAEAGKALQIKVTDHIIIGDNTHYSFADHGLI